MSYTPFGCCDLSSKPIKRNVLEKFQQYINELKKLHGEESSKKIIELDGEIHPTIQDIDQDIELHKK